LKAQPKAKPAGVHSGLPRPIERMVLRRYKGSAGSRLGAAVTLRALGVLLRDHPKTALEIAGASLAQAGRSGFDEVKKAVLPSDRQKKRDDTSAEDAGPEAKPEAS
jgi:hypothetical protein